MDKALNATGTDATGTDSPGTDSPVAHQQPLTDFQHSILREIEYRLRHAVGGQIKLVSFSLVTERDIAWGEMGPCVVQESSNFVWPPQRDDRDDDDDDDHESQGWHGEP